MYRTVPPHRTRYSVICAAILFSFMAAKAIAGITPTTTLAAETGNNTSASSSFANSLNGNAGAGNVSKLPIRSLLYSGANTKVYVNWVGWFGPPNHINVGYTSATAEQVHRQVEDMISRGIDGVVVDWFGPTLTDAFNPVNAATQLMKAEAELHPGFEFSIMEDVGALGQAAKDNDCDVTTQLINDLKYIIDHYVNSPAYTRVDGRPVIMFFGVSAYFIDWNQVRSSVSSTNPLFIFRGTYGLGGQTASDGAFQWVDIAKTDPFDPELDAQDQFYSAALNTSAVSFGSAYKGFNDSVAAWSGNRFIHQRCGATWLETFGEVAKFYSANNQLRQIQLVTWNDYEEGTEIETGVDNCVYVTPSIDAAMLSWTIGGGSENTIDHYTVFVSSDGENLAQVADRSPGNHTFNLASLGLPAGSYTVYVKAVGKASIQNKMSPPIVYQPGNVQPRFTLSVNMTGGLSVSADIDVTLAPHGVGSTSIDFGDGTVVSGPSATHTYARADSFVLTATVFDQRGASALQRQQVTVKSPSPGVTVLSPAPGAVVNSPVLFSATANSDTQISLMQVFVDGNLTYVIDRDFILSALKIYKGTHHITVQAVDAAGSVLKRELDVTGEPNDLPPIAKVTVKPAPGGTPLSVLVCNANSTDPDGFVSGRAMQFSDGPQVFGGPSVVHTFAAAGNYSVNLAVSDQFGAVASTSLAFNVPLSGSLCASSLPGVTVCSPPEFATISSPVHFAASANSLNAQITAMAVYIDYQLALLVDPGSSIDQLVNVAPCTHGVIVQAWDATGAVFQQPLTMTVNGCPTPEGVTVQSPQNGETVSSPVSFSAFASSALGSITAMAVYVDYNLAFQGQGSSLPQGLSLNLSPGTHGVIVQAWNQYGAVFKTSLTLNVSP